MIEDVSIKMSVKVTKKENIKEFDPVIPWARYLLLEKAFLEFLEYVPFVPKHYEVTSPFLDDLLIRSCTLLESFWKSAALCDSMDSCIYKYDLEKIRTVEEGKITIFERVFNSFFKLSQKEIYYIHRGYQHTFIPFENWEKDNHPKWWTIYNRLKHQGFANSGTYIDVRNALGGLFLNLVIHKEMITYLEAISAINDVGYENLKSLYRRAPDFSMIARHFNGVARTDLFGFAYCLRYHYDNEDNRKLMIFRMFTPPYEPDSDYKTLEEMARSQGSLEKYFEDPPTL